jgi:predicted DNA-binding transcriptional regulator AlpA
MLTIKKVKMTGLSLVFDLTEEQIKKLKQDLMGSTEQEQKPKGEEVNYINTNDAIRKYKISRKTLARWISDGLPYIKSRPNVFVESDIENFIQRKFIRKK